jgi:hypothetical protein
VHAARTQHGNERRRVSTDESTRGQQAERWGSAAAAHARAGQCRKGAGDASGSWIRQSKQRPCPTP